MIDKRNFRLMAASGFAAALILPAMASHAHDTRTHRDKECSETLARDIKIQVKAGMAKAAVGMEKGAEEMLRGADRMEAYADRLERDSAFREREVARQNGWRDGKVTAQQLLESAPEMRAGAGKMREGAEKMRAGAVKMRRGDAH